MGLPEHLKEQINKDYELLKKLEDRLRTEPDPRLELRWTEDIKKVKQRIRQREEELRSLSVSSVQPEPVTPYPSRPVTPPPKPKQEVKPDQVELRSERGIDYTLLQKLLELRAWKEADIETAKVMCQAAGRESEGWLALEDIRNFPCEDLRTINELWLHYSDGKFGFSVQKEIYESLGEIGNKAKIWKSFCTRIGWRKGGKWVRYSELTFNLELAPQAHLPRAGLPEGRFPWMLPLGLFVTIPLWLSGRPQSYGAGSLMVPLWVSSLWQRLITCKI